MKTKTDISGIIKELKSSSFMRSCHMQLGYGPGLPIINKINSTVCITVPYLKYKITGEVDKTLVYPIKYAVTIKLPQKNIVKFEDMEIHPAFRRIEFSKPIGFFRHDSIKGYNKARYESEKEKLYELYNKVIECEIKQEPCSEAITKQFKELLGIMIEPSLKAIYKVLGSDFYDKYLA